MVSIVRVLCCLVVLIGATAHASSSGADGCTKLIFNRFCLGGQINTLDGIASRQSIGDDATLHVLENTPKHIELIERQGRITAVLRREQPGGWLNFTEWKTKLVRLYGKGQDLGYFPDYATSRSSRLNAINAGKGFAHFRWQEVGWSVSLRWNHRDYLELHYELDAGNDAIGSDEGL